MYLRENESSSKRNLILVVWKSRKTPNRRMGEERKRERGERMTPKRVKERPRVKEGLMVVEGWREERREVEVEAEKGDGENGERREEEGEREVGVERERDPREGREKGRWEGEKPVDCRAADARNRKAMVLMVGCVGREGKRVRGWRIKTGGGQGVREMKGQRRKRGKASGNRVTRALSRADF